MAIRPIPGGNGDKYVPYDKRSGDTSIVFFTRDLSEEGMIKIYEKVSSVLEGKIAIKLHTGEAEGPNIIPRPWVRNLIEKKLPDANIVETRHGLRQLSYMKELGMGNDLYTLIDIDNGDKEITATEAVKDVEPIWKPDKYNVFWGRNKH